LLVHADWRWFVVPFGAALIGLLLVGTYRGVVTVLRYLLLGYFAYAASAVIAHPHWGQVLHATLVPSLSLRGPVATGALALLGTTLTSYVYMWETVSQAEETAKSAPRPERLAVARADAVAGAAFLVATLWFILIASGATLGTRRQPVATAQQAAAALRPLAGNGAATLFAAGLLVSAVVALPVLMATTAYAVGGHFDWRRGLSERAGAATRFYAVLVLAVAVGAALAFTGVSPIGILVAASIAGAFGTPISLAFLVRLARDPQVMGDHVVSRRLGLAAGAVAAVIAGIGLVYLAGLG
jgi:Mn2+/Fe2+ NRAMP family transporter